MAMAPRGLFSATVITSAGRNFNSTSSGQLFCALDSLERWLTLKVDAGEDLTPWCERLLELQNSTAILGVLVNLGKYQSALFKSALLPVVGLERLYWYDASRVANVGFNFVAWHWARQGDAIFNMARDWVLAPHRKIELRAVISDLTLSDPSFAATVVAAAAEWPVPEDPKQALEQRILQAQFDPANRHTMRDETTGETVLGVAYPPDLQSDILAYQSQANASLQSLMLPHQCEKILAADVDLSAESAQFLAEMLPEDGGDLPDTGDQRRMIAAAAATLIARGGNWYAARSDVAARAFHVVRATIFLMSGTTSDGNDFASDEALRFAAIGAFHAALDADDPARWNDALTMIISGRDRGALATLMRVAARNRERLGHAWYRLNFLLVLFAGLNRLSPRHGEEDALRPVWDHWLVRLRAQPVFGIEATIAIVNPANIARRAERLLERRRARQHPKRPARLSGKSRRFAGLSVHILESGYAWLLNHETAEATAASVENRQLVADLWMFEAWRMKGEGDGEADVLDNDGEYDLPSGMGYSILRIAPSVIMAAPPDEAERLWRAIIGIGPNGYHAVEQFAASWFLLLYKQPDPDQFMAIWMAVLSTAFAADWRAHRRWYRGRDMLVKLLGLHAASELSQANEVRARIPELIGFYRQWAYSQMPGAEDEMGSFCHFLTTEAGRSLRLEGVIWVRDALTTSEQFSRGSTGNNIAEAIDTLIAQHAVDLIANESSRAAVIDIVAKLVEAQVATAMGLQRRIAALK
ncbi:hypothetical protein NKH14_33285 [Mesorhizobium sp. M1380]|uniref:hypothetical protein n=1 Tax=Mesorhizobium sp. M1380 TaxID=2957093 RepID=UPI00333545EF